MIWRLFKLIWQVNLTSYNLSSELKRGKRARWQVKMSSQLVKLTSLSSGTCQRKWALVPTKKISRRQTANLFWESLARQRNCLRDFSVLLLRVLACLKAMFSDGQDMKYDRDISPRPHFFHSTNSHKSTQVVHRKWGWTKRERVKDSVINVTERLSEVVDYE